MIWNESIECMDRESLRKIQSIRLKKIVDYVYHNTPFYRKKMQEMGAKNVLVSMAGEGAVFVGENGEVYESEAPKGKLVNSTGAGDSMVAGFLAGWIKHKDYREAMRLGICCGSASAFKDWLADRRDIDKLLDKIK